MGSRVIAYDIDGTIVYSVFQFIQPEIRDLPRLNPLIKADSVKVIISGRRETRRSETEALLEKLGVFPELLILNPKLQFGAGYITSYKADALREICADVYVDDDPITHLKLRKKWDGILINSDQVHLYNGGKLRETDRRNIKKNGNN